MAGAPGEAWAITPRAGGDLLVLVPVVPAVVGSQEGKARLSASVVGAGGWVNLLDPSGPVALGLGLGLGAGFLGYFGQPERIARTTRRAWTAPARRDARRPSR